MRYHQILLEYRIQNEKDLRDFIKTVPALRKVEDKILHILRKDTEYHRPAQISDLAPTGYDLRDFEQGSLVRVDLEIVPVLKHIADWLGDEVTCQGFDDGWWLDQDETKTKLNRIKGASSINQMSAMADAYFREKNKKLSGEEDWDGIEEVIAYEDGHKWLRLTSKKALQREGKLMDHCVASYWERVSINQYRVYSLRDNDNMPLATIGAHKIEMMYRYIRLPRDERPDKWIIDQIQGPGNSNVDRKYASEIDDLEKKLDIDLRGLGA